MRSAGTPVTRSLVGCGVRCVFPETQSTIQSNPPKSKWNPTRGPSWHPAPSASGQVPRFYVHCALYGSSYIPKCQSFPQTPCEAETRIYSPLPSISQHPLSGFFFFKQIPPSFDLLGLTKDAPFSLRAATSHCVNSSAGQMEKNLKNITTHFCER